MFYLMGYFYTKRGNEMKNILNNRMNIILFLSAILLMFIQIILYKIGANFLLDGLGISKKVFILFSTLIETLSFTLLLITVVICCFLNKNNAKKLEIYLPLVILAVYLLVRFTYGFAASGIHDSFEQMALMYKSAGLLEIAEPRGFVYPFQVLLTSVLFGSFEGTTFFQMLCGLAEAFLLFSIFMNIHKLFIPKLYSNKYNVLVFLAALLMIFYLFSTHRISGENLLRPESCSRFLQIVSIWCLLWVYKKPTIVRYVVSLLFFILFFNFQNKMMFFVPLCVIVLTVYLLIKSDRLHKIMILVGFIFCLVFSSVVSLGISKVFIEDKDSTNHFAWKTFFVSIYHIINIEMEDDFKDPNYTKYPKEILQMFNEHYLTVSDRYKNMDIDKFDSVMHHNPEFKEILNTITATYGDGNLSYINTFMRSYCIKTVLSHPLKYAQKVLCVYGNCFTNYSAIFRNAMWHNLAGNYESQISLMKNGTYGNCELGKKFVSTLEKKQTKVFNGIFNFFILNVFYYLTVVILPIWMLFSIITYFFAFNKCRERNILFYLAVAFFVLLSVVYLVSALTTYSLGRYSFEVFPLILLSTVFCLEYLVVVINDKVKGRGKLK